MDAVVDDVVDMSNEVLLKLVQIHNDMRDLQVSVEEVKEQVAILGIKL